MFISYTAIIQKIMLYADKRKCVDQAFPDRGNSEHLTCDELVFKQNC
jgi:hypothetical protein